MDEWLTAHAILLMKLLNFALMAGLLAKFVFKPIQAMLGEMAGEIAGELDEAIQAKDEAEKKLQENQQKLSRSGEEVEQLMVNAQKRAEGIKAEIAEEAEADEVRLEAVRLERLRLITFHGRESIKKEFANRAVMLAKKQIKKSTTVQDHQRWNNEFFGNLRK